ncbi:MAG: hypothetical protein Q9168_001611 [Polycauliona sp. 1 TL-2023]
MMVSVPRATGCRCTRRDAQLPPIYRSHLGRARESQRPPFNQYGFIPIEPNQPSVPYQPSQYQGLPAPNTFSGPQPGAIEADEQQHSRENWSNPSFDFNNFSHTAPIAPVTMMGGSVPNPTPRPGSCCSKASAMGPSPKESTPRSIETTIITPSAHEPLVANAARSKLTVSQEDKGKGEEGEIWSPNSLLQTAIIDAPQTTMYPMPANYGSIDNPMTSYQHERLRGSVSWRPQQVPYYADDGISASAADRADSSEDNPRCFSCPCGDECTCLMCTAHPHNPASIEWVQGLFPYWSSDPANLPTGPQSTLPDTLGQNAAAFIDEHALSQSNSIEDPTTNGIQDNATYDPTVEAHAGEPSTLEQMSSRDYFCFAYDFPTSGNLVSNPCPAIPGTCRCADGCPCVGCRNHVGHRDPVAEPPYFVQPPYPAM